MVLFSLLFIKRGTWHMYYDPDNNTLLQKCWCIMYVCLCESLRGRLVTAELCWICSCFTYGLSLPLRCSPVSRTATYSSVFTHIITAHKLGLWVPEEEQTYTESWMKHETVNTALAILGLIHLYWWLFTFRGSLCKLQGKCPLFTTLFIMNLGLGEYYRAGAVC